MVRWLHYKYISHICQKPRETINMSKHDEKLLAKNGGGLSIIFSRSKRKKMALSRSCPPFWEHAKTASEY